MSGRHIGIMLKVMEEALELYREDGRVGDREEELLVWLWHYAHHELDANRDRLCERLGAHWSTVNKVFRGKYEARLDSFCELIESLRRRVAEGRVANFEETPVTRKIMAALDYARDEQTMALVCGPSGCSKTETLKEWSARNNHGRTIYVELPSSCTRAKLVRSIAKAMTLGTSHKDMGTLEITIKNALKPNRVLLLDEAGYIIPDGREKSNNAIEFVRELREHCKCAVVLCVPSPYWHAMLNGPHADVLEQVVGRISYRLIVPRDKVFVGELEAMVRLYGRVEPTPALIKEAARITKSHEGRLRTLCEDLRKAAKVARQRGEEVTVQHLQAAAEFREAGGNWDDEEVA